MYGLLAHLVAIFTWTQLALGLILLQPETLPSEVSSEEYSDVPESELFEKLFEANADRRFPFKDRYDEKTFDIYDDEYNDKRDAYDPDVKSSASFDGLEDDALIDETETPIDAEYGYMFDTDKGDLYSRSEGLNLRKKRSLSGRIDAKVGVLVVVDNVIYRRYLEKTRNQREALAMLRQYYGMLFAMVDQRFNTIQDPELSISVKISGILVAESRQEAGWVEYLVKWSRAGDEGRVSANKALKKFIAWLLTQKTLPAYDHAMAFTGYHLVNKASVDLGGMAYVKSICNTKDGNSASIVADPGDFQAVKVATHELAHSLGASHDGDKYNTDCPPDDNYIMAQQTTIELNKLRNAFYFSPCSVRQMKELLGSDKASCVRDHPVVYYQYNLQRQPPGQRYTAHQQCKLIFGKESEFCGTEKMKSVMCGQLWCKDPENGKTCRTHSFLTALPGTDCAANKVCHLGECQRSPYGDQASRRFQYNRIITDRSRGRDPQRSRLNNKPTFRIRTRPNAAARSGRRRQNPRRQGNRSSRRRSRGRTGRRRTRTRQRRCTADQNVDYCTGLIKVNPRACRRKAVRKYCCATCALQRRRRRKKL